MNPTVLSSEFASVRVEIDHESNSPRLKITNLMTGWKILLDPLEVASLTTLSHADFARLIHPDQFNKPLHDFDASSVQQDFLAVGVEDVEAFLKELGEGNQP